MSFAAPVTLRGDLVELTPLDRSDAEGIAAAARDGELWNLFYTRVPRPEEVEETIASRLAMRDAGTMVPFAVRRAGTGEVLGMTSYCNIDTTSRRLEIGYTWYAASAQRTGVNAEAKLLLLGHAFEDLGCIAVELRTHWLNSQSRRAIERLGAKQDGVLRSHMVMPDGTLRDTVVYSIVASEWPAVRNGLRLRLA